jgi:large subunit ribosomal protein L5|tara:strand:- start:129 stop:707 length:579 start_codon:yes stop_codon:yes gene_type:complete
MQKKLGRKFKMSYTPRLQEKYRNEVVPALKEKFNYKSVMQVPKVEKIVISQGVGEAVADRKLIDSALEDLSAIAGQKALMVKSKKDVSNFKLRKGMPIGTKVTLRREKMYEFLDRFISIALPRTRDFRGVKSKGDGRGNFTFGVTESIIFPEIDIDKVKKILGMDITIVTSANTNEEGMALLEEFGFPFAKK